MPETLRTTAYKDPRLPPAPAVPAGPDWVNLIKTLDAGEAETLVAVLTTLYPHENISVIPYRRVTCHFDRLAAVSPEAARHMREFLAQLAEASPVRFYDLAETYRIQALRHIETTPAFFFVQRMGVRFLYDDVELWAQFGYEGASVHLGGYIDRGFNDLDWLPPLPNDI